MTVADHLHDELHSTLRRGRNAVGLLGESHHEADGIDTGWLLLLDSVGGQYVAQSFKALKQNLKIKTFVGTSPNAVKIQVWSALIAILLLRYMQLKSRFGWSLSNLVALLRMNLFTYRDLWAWLDNPFSTPPPDEATIRQQVLALA